MAGMSEQTAALPRDWPRVKWTRAAQVAPLLGEVPDLAALGTMEPAAAFAVLRDDDPAGAVRFMAHCLSRVDAVRWVAACLPDAGQNVPPARAVAAKAVRRWVANPSDEARRLAYDAGLVAGWDTMEGMACLAVFMSGGSMAPAEQEVPVNPPPGVFGQMAAGAVLLAAHADGARAFAGRIASMLAVADAIAAGEHRA
jgi:hypothetical protein